MARYAYSPDVYDPRVIDALLTIARRRQLGREHQLAALACGIVEDQLRHRAAGHGTSVGWRQETRSSYGSVERRMDLAASIDRFYDELGPSRPPSRTIGSWVQSVQRSAHPGRYDEALPAAQRVLDVWVAANPTAGGGQPDAGGADPDTPELVSQPGGEPTPDATTPPEPPRTRPGPPTPPPAPWDLPDQLYGPGTILVRGQEVLDGESLDLRAQVNSAALTQTIDGPATLDVELDDADRSIRRSTLFDIGPDGVPPVMEIGGVQFGWTGLSTSGSRVSLTFRDVVAADLQRRRGPDPPVVQAPDTGTFGDFIRRLVAETGWTADVEGGPVALFELKRGTEDDPREDSWTTIKRACDDDDVKFRLIAVANRLLAGSDGWLTKRWAPVDVAEHQGGVDDIDIVAAAGVKVETLTFTFTGAIWALPPTSLLRVVDPGPTNGIWMVSKVSRSLYELETSVEAVRRSLDGVELAGEAYAESVENGGPVPWRPGAERDGGPTMRVGQ